MRRLATRPATGSRVDSLAELYAQGILLEHFRWAELEQLVYSASRWERRLVGSTVARLPLELPRARRHELDRTPGLTLIKSLIGDSEPDVQKALSWALRSWLEVDPTRRARVHPRRGGRCPAADDGHRAWVLRDALTAPSIEPASRPRSGTASRASGAAPANRRPATAATVAAGFAGFEHMADVAVDQQGDRQQMAPLRRSRRMTDGRRPRRISPDPHRGRAAQRATSTTR